MWQKELTSAMETLVFVSIYSDVCIFRNSDATVYVQVFVDDLQVTGPSLFHIRRFKEACENAWMSNMSTDLPS